MGQYYKPLIIDGSDVIVYNRDVNGEYMVAKLCEHSWWENPAVGKVFNYIKEHPCIIAWVGDYVENSKVPNTPFTGNQVWDMKDIELETEPLSPMHYFLVNHSKRMYLDLDLFYKNSINDSRMCMHPLPLLTACGNGLGGGDYYGINECDVGYWAGDVISVENHAYEPYEEYKVSFQ